MEEKEMEYIYSAMLLHSAGKKITEENVKKVLTAAGVKADDARIKVSTIHAAKGGECENVILVLDNAKKIREAVTKSVIKRDEEHRVWYVGCTRAKRNLYLMRAKIERKGYPL